MPYSASSFLNVVAIDTLSKTMSTATLLNLFCSDKEIPNFSKVFNSSGSTSCKLFNFFL
jgi:hypothetical protein